MNDHEMLVNLLNAKAEKARQAGDKQTALELFTKAAGAIKLGGVSPDTEAGLCTNFGLLMLSNGQVDEAVELQKKALGLDKQTGHLPSLGYSYHNLGWALFRKRAFGPSIENLTKARDIRQSIPDYRELLNTLGCLAQVYLAAGQYDDAGQAAGEALALEKILDRVPGLRHALWVLAMLAVRKGDHGTAKQRYSELTELLEDLREANSSLARLDLFDSRYNKYYEDTIEYCLDAGEHAAALDLIDRTRFRSGCDALEGPCRFPAAFGDKSTDGFHLRDDEMILTNWIYPDTDHSFCLTGRHGLIYRKTKTSDNQGKFRRLDLRTQWEIHLENLLGQAQAGLDDFQDILDNYRRIILIPHGARWQAPFSGLVHPVSREPLLRTHELVLMPSLRYGRITRGRPLNDTGRHLVIGDPTGDLKWALREAKQVADTLGCDCLTGSDATRAAVLGKLTGTRYDTVHFACHGYYDETGMQGLVMSDGLIDGRDILETRLSASIVNLASCWGGMVYAEKWTELKGFLRSFFMLGVGNIISSVYPVNDNSAYEFNHHFYKKLVSGVPAVGAFRSAIERLSGSPGLKGWTSFQISGRH